MKVMNFSVQRSEVQQQRVFFYTCYGPQRVLIIVAVTSCTVHTYKSKAVQISAAYGYSYLQDTWLHCPHFAVMQSYAGIGIAVSSVIRLRTGRSGNRGSITVEGRDFFLPEVKALIQALI
jgi:hypothetical protein